jgi:hypothetical protein
MNGSDDSGHQRGSINPQFILCAAKKWRAEWQRWAHYRTLPRLFDYLVRDRE